MSDLGAAAASSVSRAQAAGQELIRLKVMKHHPARRRFAPNDLPTRSRRPDRNNRPKTHKRQFVTAGLINNPQPKYASLGNYDYSSLAGASDPAYLAANNYRVFADWGRGGEVDPTTVDWSTLAPSAFNYMLRQEPGPTNALGLVRFSLTNSFDVYLHDTPSKNLFNRDARRFSHGCIRVEDPRKLAALLMKKPLEAIDDAIATGDTAWAALPKAVPVFVVYEPAFADADGKRQYRADNYKRDTEISQALDPKRRTVAERKTPDQTGR